MRILFIGTGGIGVPALQSLLQPGAGRSLIGVVTQPDKPAGRKMELRPSPIKELAMQHGIGVFQPSRIRDPAAVEKIQSFDAEIIVVMAYGQILPAAVLRAPSIACLNLHASLLPRHRGAAPIQASIMAGDAETGITVMYMAEGLDTGDILLEKRIPIHDRETGGSLHGRLAETAPGALAEALTLLKQCVAPRVPQDSARATYAPKLTRESGIIDWTASQIHIDRLIRAMNPWPTASTAIPAKDGAARQLKIFAAIPLDTLVDALPGTVLHAGADGISVATADGALLLQEVQIEGKKRMPARDFLAGHPIAPGTILGARQSSS